MARTPSKYEDRYVVVGEDAFGLIYERTCWVWDPATDAYIPDERRTAAAIARQAARAKRASTSRRSTA